MELQLLIGQKALQLTLWEIACPTELGKLCGVEQLRRCQLWYCRAGVSTWLMCETILSSKGLHMTIDRVAIEGIMFT